MTEKMTRKTTRRNFLQLASVGAAASLMGAGRTRAEISDLPPLSRKPLTLTFKLGLATYTLRKFNLEETLAMTRRVALEHVCFKSMHLPLNSTFEIVGQPDDVQRQSPLQ